MQDCTLYEIHLTAYAAAELVEPDLSAMESHLQHCADCHAELVREIELRTALAGLPLAQCPDTVTQFLQQTLALDGASTPERRTNWRPAGVGLVAAALLAVLLVPGPLRGPNVPGPVALETATVVPEYSAAEIAQARRDVIATLVLAADVLDRSRDKTVVNVFGARLPGAISGSLRRQSSDAQIHNNATENNPTGGNG